MGLDSFWKLPRNKTEPTFEPELSLVGGMFSGNGEGSFRGKIYADIIDHVTGVSIYQEKIPNRTIKQMAKKLDAFNMTSELWDEWKLYDDQPLTEWHDLVRMFKRYADVGAQLHGWW